jgi:hypothetical protein
VPKQSHGRRLEYDGFIAFVLHQQKGWAGIAFGLKARPFSYWQASDRHSGCTPPPRPPSVEAIAKAWIQVRKAKNTVVLLDGIVSCQPPSFVEQILTSANDCNVFVADAEQAVAERFGPRILPSVHRVKACLTSNDYIQISTEEMK